MSIFDTRNWTAELRQQAQLQSQLHAFRQAQWGAEFDRATAHSYEQANQQQQSDIAKEAREGTVIEGVVVRKPQPRLT